MTLNLLDNWIVADFMIYLLNLLNQQKELYVEIWQPQHFNVSQFY